MLASHISALSRTPTPVIACDQRRASFRRDLFFFFKFKEDCLFPRLFVVPSLHHSVRHSVRPLSCQHWLLDVKGVQRVLKVVANVTCQRSLRSLKVITFSRGTRAVPALCHPQPVHQRLSSAFWPHFVSLSPTYNMSVRGVFSSLCVGDGGLTAGVCVTGR